MIHMIHAGHVVTAHQGTTQFLSMPVMYLACMPARFTHWFLPSGRETVLPFLLFSVFVHIVIPIHDRLSKTGPLTIPCIAMRRQS